MSIVVLGSVFVDIKGYPSGNYIPAGRNAGRIRYVHGGVSRNIAEDLGNLGLSPVFLSLVDPSGIGNDVINRLKEHQVDTRYIRAVEGGMGTWLAVFDNNNDVCASISSRPDLSPLLDILQDHGEELFAAADSILLELDMEDAILRKVYHLAKKHGKPVYAAVSNINLAMERREYLRETGCFVCNRSEAGILFSTEFSGSDMPPLSLQLSSRVRDAGIPAMVVTLGGDGAVWAKCGGSFGCCESHAVPVADTTGAGDAFFAGVAAGLSAGKPLSEACDIGSRLAASVICTLENTCPRFQPAEFGLA